MAYLEVYCLVPKCLENRVEILFSVCPKCNVKAQTLYVKQT